MLRTTFLIAFLFLLSATICWADDWVSPDPKESQSPNGLYKVRTELGSSIGDSVGFKGAAKGEFAKAELTGPKGEKRTFTLLNPISPVDIVLLDDGTLLAFDNWHNMGYGAVLVSYSAEGAVKWSHTLEELLPKEVLERVPMSISSRWWRKQPLEWKVREGHAETFSGFVTLWNEDVLKIDLGTGAVEYVKVHDLGEDPQRLLRRGRDLLEQGEFAKAAEVLKQSIALKPDLIDAYRELAWVYSRQENYTAALKILEDGIRQNPPSEIKPSGGLSSDPRMWLWLELGRTYVSAGRLAEAERTFQENLRIDPTDWYPVEGLARLLLDQSRGEEADRLLAKYFEVRSSGPEHTRDWGEEDAGRSIGNLYRSRGLYEKARTYYLRAYRGEHDGLVSEPLAEVLERCGRYEEALSVLEKSREWMSSVESFKMDLAEVEASIQRVKEKKAQRESGKTLSNDLNPSPPKNSDGKAEHSENKPAKGTNKSDTEERRSLKLRRLCERLMTPEVEAAYYAVGTSVSLAKSDEVRRRGMAPVVSGIRQQLGKLFLVRKFIVVDLLYVVCEACRGKEDFSEYERLNLINSTPGRYTPGHGSVMVAPRVKNIWLSQYSFPKEASYPSGRPTLLLQCWAAE